MGSIRLDLFKCQLPEREKHHSRLFIDLAENIHIHHREYRTVFTLDEFFEYADILNKSVKDVRSYLTQNPDYREQKFPTTLMIAGGKERQLKFLKNSPQPNKSHYFSNDFAIELQDVFVTDEIHIHYRDFRIGLSREHFRQIAKGFTESLSVLDDFEANNEYIRESHSDRIISNFNENDKDFDTKLMGSTKLKLSKIKSFWHKNIEKDFQPKQESIEALKKGYEEEKSFFPVLLSTEKDGTHFIVDGHHRVLAALQLGLEEIDCVVTKLTFEETKKLRQAEALLKEFDYDTDNKFNMSSFMKEKLAFSLNRHYVNSYAKHMKGVSLIRKVLRKIKRMLVGKKQIFKAFNEAHNQ